MEATSTTAPRRQRCGGSEPPDRVSEAAVKRVGGGNRTRLPPADLPVNENGCVIEMPTVGINLDLPPPPDDSLASYRAWLSEASMKLRGLTFDNLVTYLSYIVHGAMAHGRHLCISCLKSFPTGEELEKHMWGNLSHLGLPLLRTTSLRSQDPDSQAAIYSCPFQSDRKCQITLHQTLTPACRVPTWALTMAHGNAPTGADLQLEHFPNTLEEYRYNPQLSRSERNLTEISEQERQTYMALLRAWGERLTAAVQARPAQEVPTVDPAPPEPAERTGACVHPSILYAGGIAPESYQQNVDVAALTREMIQRHNENEGLRCMRERIVRSMDCLHASYESVEAFPPARRATSASLLQRT